MIWTHSLSGEALMKPLVGPMLQHALCILSTSNGALPSGQQCFHGALCIPSASNTALKGFQGQCNGRSGHRATLHCSFPLQSLHSLVPTPSLTPTIHTMTKSTSSFVRRPWNLGSGRRGTSMPGWPESARSVTKDLHAVARCLTRWGFIFGLQGTSSRGQQKAWGCHHTPTT